MISEFAAFLDMEEIGIRVVVEKANNSNGKEVETRLAGKKNWEARNW